MTFTKQPGIEKKHWVVTSKKPPEVPVDVAGTVLGASPKTSDHNRSRSGLTNSGRFFTDPDRAVPSRPNECVDIETKIEFKKKG